MDRQCLRSGQRSQLTPAVFGMHRGMNAEPLCEETLDEQVPVLPGTSGNDRDECHEACCADRSGVVITVSGPRKSRNDCRSLPSRHPPQLRKIRQLALVELEGEIGVCGMEGAKIGVAASIVPTEECVQISRESLVVQVQQE